MSDYYEKKLLEQMLTTVVSELQEIREDISKLRQMTETEYNAKYGDKKNESRSK